jgi:hypothetical protein
MPVWGIRLAIIGGRSAAAYARMASARRSVGQETAVRKAHTRQGTLAIPASGLPPLPGPGVFNRL